MPGIPAPVRHLIEPLPFPVRFSDGKIRLATTRLALLRRLWAHFDSSRDESRQALAAYAGGDVLDVGAFHGWYTALLAPRAAPGDRIVSFEPDPDAIPTLQSVLSDVGRHFPSIGLPFVTQPVGDGRPVAMAHPGGTGSHPQYNGSGGGDGPTSLTIDEYVTAQRLHPRLIKVDVEGAELAVLEGMRRTLAEHRPALMLEIHPQWQPHGTTAADVEAFMRGFDYAELTLDDQPIARRQLWRPRESSGAASEDDLPAEPKPSTRS